MLHAIPVAALLVTPEGLVRASNRGARALLGGSQETLEGLALEALLPGAKVDPEGLSLGAGRKLAWDAEGRRSLRSNLRRPGGEVVSVRLGAARLEVEGGFLVLLHLRDGVSGQLDLDAEPAEQSDAAGLYRLLAETSTDVVARNSFGGAFLYVSPSCRLFGYEPAELLGRRLQEFLDERDVERVERLAQSLAVSPGTTLTQYRFRCKDGRWLWVEATLRAVLDPETGLVREFQSSARDVTARVEAEERLARSEAEHRHLTEQSVDILLRLSERDVVLYVSPACREVLGYAPEELLGRSLQEFLVPEDLPRLERVRERNRVQEFPEGTMTFSLRTRDGMLVTVESSYRTVLEPDGATKSRVAVLRDVTERLRIDSLLRHQVRLNSFEAEVARELNRPQPLPTLLGRSLALVGRTLGGAQAVLLLAEPLDGRRVFTAGGLRERELPRALSEALLSRARALGHGFFAEDLFAGGAGEAPWVAALGAGAVAAVPMEAEGRLCGVALAGTQEGFGGTSLDLLERFGRLVAHALERERLANYLGDKEARLRALVEALSDTVLIFDREAVCVEVVAVGAGTFGHPLDAIVGRSAVELFGDELGGCVVQLMEHTRATQTVPTFELFVPGAEGLEWFETRFAEVRPQGRDEGMVVLKARNVTERRLIEETERMRNRVHAALAREDPLPSILGFILDDVEREDPGATAVLLMVDDEGSRLEPAASGSAAAGAGQWLRGVSLLEEGSTLVRAWSERCAEAYLEQGREVAWVDPVLCTSGEPLALLVVRPQRWRERTRLDQKRLRQTVELLRLAIEQYESTESIRKLTQAVEHCPLGVVITQTNQEIEYANPAFCAMTGWSLSEVLGRTPAELGGDSLSAEAAGASQRALEGGGVWEGEVRRRRRGGEEYFEHNHVAAIRNRRGRVSHYVAIKEDVTEQRRDSEELRRARDTADASNKAKSLFLANVSHEIRTPLNAIIGMTHLCLATDLSEKQRDYVSKVNRSARGLLAIVKDLLDISKAEADKVVLERTEVNLPQLLATVDSLTGYLAREKNVSLEVQLAPEVPKLVQGDPTRLQQVLLNLVGNAVKFTERGSVRVRLSVRESDDRGVLLEARVEDTGIGMSKAQLERLFQPFVQADPSTTRRFGGTGLGLAICKRLVEMMGGELWVLSEEGRGSTFGFTVRMEHCATPVSDLPAREQEALRVAQEKLRGARLLVVEDNPFNQQVARELAEAVGAEVTVAATGLEAVEAVREGRVFDVVLMDLQMPVMDGFEATLRLRGLPAGAKVPILAVTASVASEDRSRSLAAGMNDELLKPLDPEQFYKTLARWKGALAETTVTLPLGAEPLASPWELPEATRTVLDTVALGRYVRNDASRVRQLARRFVDLTRGELAALGKAVKADEVSAAGDLAHKIKSAARSVGALRIAACCERLELHGRSLSSAQREELLRVCEEELQRAVREVEAMERAS